jgi:hypothetical protein
MISAPTSPPMSRTTLPGPVGPDLVSAMVTPQDGLK